MESEPIAKARLLATPEVTRGIACQKNQNIYLTKNESHDYFSRRCLYRSPRSPSHVVRP